MDNKIGIIGGDLRIIKLCELLVTDNYILYTYGLEKWQKDNRNIIICKNLLEFYENIDTVIGGIPFSKDNISIYAPYSDKNIKIKEVFDYLKNKTLIAGAIKEEINNYAKNKNIEIIDLMKDESLKILNAIPTVEGAIQIAMENTDITIHNSKCMVLGFGRIGKLLSKQLKALGANVCCVARKEKDLAWIKTYGYTAIHLKNLLENINKFDIIFNTVPAIILDQTMLEQLKYSNTIIIDLASMPGGVDLEFAKKYNIKTIQALGLPGKCAPVTSAIYIKNSIEKI